MRSFLGRVILLVPFSISKQSTGSVQSLSNYQWHFHRTRTKNFAVCIETQKTPNCQSNLEKEKRSWRNQFPWLQTVPQSYSNPDSMVLTQKQKYRSMEQDWKPRDNPTKYGQLFFDKGGKNIQWRKDSLSISGAGKTRQLYVKEWN